MKKNLYLFRHGQSEWNQLRKIQGVTDIPLTSLGVQQAKRIPQYLKSKKLGIIYSSYLKRAWKTGKIVANDLGIDVRKYPDLHEVDYGDLAGETKDGLSKKLGDNFYEKWSGNDPQYDYLKTPNGESKIESRYRMINALINITKDASCENIGVATHDFVMKQVLIFCGYKDCNKLKNCEIAHIQCDMDKLAKSPYKAFKVIKRIRTDE